ncbi:MAG: FecR domain-containing protein [Acidobacteriia bacterium]|nr:FecR domain-containing protein [Terriglobia bacterium]
MKKYLASLAAMFLMLGVIPASAQDEPPRDQAGQPVELQPGVARVSFMHGDVSSQRGDNGEWVAVTLNTPISTDDRVSTGEKSRAELQLDYADVLRMADSATARVASLTRTHIQLQVGQGLVSYSVFKGSEADSEIDTPNASIHPQGPGEYRILVNSDAETQVVVRQGSAEITTPQGSTHVEKGQMITVVGTDSPEYKTASAPGRDDWDSWNDDRNHRISNAESWRKTNHYYTGSEDLDAYGHWRDVPDYGPVWVPSSAGPDWAPYRDGRWVYEPYYGWTWVSYEPWGWAPYHYGRWFVYGGDWVWWPGPVVAYPAYYPVWAPAYVSFFGFGGGGWGVSVGFGFGGFGRVGWLPTGPCDGFHPWWGRWGNRVNVVNVTNIHNTTIINNNFRDSFRPLAGDGFRGRRFSNVDEAFRNDRVRGGMSSMAGNEFGRAAVSRHQDRISEASFRQSSLVAGKMPMSPSRESFSPSGRAANPSAFRSAPPNTQRFFNGGARANNTNASAPRSFGNANEANRPQSGFGNRSANGATMTQAPRTLENPSQSGREQSPSGNNRSSGWFGRSSAQAPQQTPSQTLSQNRGNAPAPAQSNRPGWHTFTPPQSGAVARPAPGSSAGNRGEVNNSGRGSFAPPSRPSSQGGSQGAPQGGPAENRSGWQHFTPPSRTVQPQESGRGFAQPNQSQRSFNPPSAASRGSNPNSYSRPPLNMRQPIVTPRGGGSYGGNYPRGSYSQPRGGYSAPRGNGGYSAPRGGNGGGGNRGGGGGGGGNRGSESHSNGGRSR